MNVDAASGDTVTCKELQSDAQQGPVRVLYALVTAHPAAHSFDLAVTDGSAAWAGQGLQASKVPGLTDHEAWAAAAQLLTAPDSPPQQRAAALAVSEAANGDLQLSWRWERGVGVGHHVLRLPAQQPGGLPAAPALSRQAHAQDVVLQYMRRVTQTNAIMQAALATCGEAQASLEASVEAMRAHVDSQAAATKARERELYLKFTMLLNSKTRQLAREHELNKQLAAEVAHMREEADAEADSDDEERARQDAAEEVAEEAAGYDAATDAEPDDDGGAVGAAAGAMNLDMAETQLLPEDALVAYEQQRVSGGGLVAAPSQQPHEQRPEQQHQQKQQNRPTLSQHLFPS